MNINILKRRHIEENLLRLFYFACLILIIAACGPTQTNLEPVAGAPTTPEESTQQIPNSPPPIVTIALPSPQITVSPNSSPAPEFVEEDVDALPLPELVEGETVEGEKDLVPEPPSAVPIQSVPIAPPALIGNQRAPTGLIFRTSAGLWQVEPDGTKKYLTPINTAVIAPNGRFALYQNETHNVQLLDLENQVEATAVPGLASGFVTWLDDHQAIAGYWNTPEEGDGPNIGRLGLFDAISGQFIPLGTELNNVLPAYSKVRQTLLYSTFNTTYLLSLGGGLAEIFDMTQYEGFPATAVFSPQMASWSPDGNKLAWILISDTNASTFVFDLEAKTASLIYSYKPAGFGGPLPAPVWSPDGRWLAQVVYGQTEASSGLWLLSVNNRDNRLLGQGVWSNPTWLSDSSSLLATHYGSQNPATIFLYDMTLQGWKSLDLPQGATISRLIIPSVSVTKISG